MFRCQLCCWAFFFMGQTSMDTFVYFTTVYIFIAYFYQGFSSSYACILYNKFFCVQSSLLRIYVTLNLPRGRAHHRPSLPRGPLLPQVAT